MNRIRKIINSIITVLLAPFKDISLFNIANDDISELDWLLIGKEVDRIIYSGIKSSTITLSNNTKLTLEK